MAAVGHIRTRTAYTETRQALARADATSGVALEALEGIYLQLSPERVWIPSDSDPAGQACACIGLRSARPAASDQLNYIQLQPSEETAALLENLLVFYDRLAEQVGDDDQVLLESAIATRRVGDIRQRLGQMDQAEREYLKAAARFDAFCQLARSDNRGSVELARVYNEIGNVRSAQLEPSAAYRAHHDALDELLSVTPRHQSAHEYRYELARTYFLLSIRYPGNTARQQGRGVDSSAERLARSPFPDKEYRKLAIDLLERLTHESPDAPDYRFLLALCYRPRGIVPARDRGPGEPGGRHRSLEILEALKTEYPQVADYRYELAVTYAWVHVDLFPWQGRSFALSTAESGLRKARDEIQWLVDHNPRIPHYARCKALVLAKLATVCSETDRSAEAANLFEQALQTQADLVDESPDLPAHDRVLLEFFRLRLAAAYLRRGDGSDDPDELSRVRDLLGTCVRNLAKLTDEYDLADDRLASTSLQIAKNAFGKLRHD
jgi:tetratricopeptide (TPR) repeat protein